MHKVELEFKRIQTYLFASPRLRAMLGANASLGQNIRVELPQIAQACGATADKNVVEKMPMAVADDPLIKALVLHTDKTILTDDPASIYKNYGVLVRDGGHFIATFADKGKADDFIKCATRQITEQLPGILMEARIDGSRFSQTNQGECLFSHPGFQVSQHLGNRPAERRNTKQHFVSAEENKLEEQGKQFRENPTDLIGILEKSKIIPCAEEPPHDLNDLVGDDYLALIHADGNGVGNRYKNWQDQFKSSAKESLEKEAYGEHFFHSMRVAVRCALVEALGVVFKDAPKNYQLLMLGGDDLLVACAAKYALPFVAAYAEALKKYPLCDDKPLTIGAGVAIAKSAFPFYRLHKMAETLADSAKQLYRVNPLVGSVVDWHVTSNAFVEDPIAERRADSLTAKAVLSCKPYPAEGEKSLQTLLSAAEELSKDAQVARSQLRGLVETMRSGENLAELNWLEIPEEMREKVGKTLKAFGQEGIFKKISAEEKISVLPDLVEIMEIDKRAAVANQESAP